MVKLNEGEIKVRKGKGQKCGKNERDIKERMRK